MLNAVSNQVPLIGKHADENVQQLHRASVIGLIVGVIGLIWARPGWPRPACSPWSRCGTCRGLRGPASCSGSGGRGCSFACSAAA